MSLPMMGCPWHGLVKGGQITFSGTLSQPYPQPSGTEPWIRGSTALIARPGQPEVVRTPEEQQEDAASGRQWWNKAILAGNQLHGVALPGWIYIDPAGDRWLVATTLSAAHINGGTCEVNLARFGVLGGRPEAYTYSVTVPDMGQSTPAIINTRGPRLARYHTSPTGNGALFEVAVEFWQDRRLYWRWRPAGWVEMTLAGLGAECQVSVVVRKTRQQTLGAISSYSVTEEDDNYFVEYLPLGGSRVVQSIPTTGNDYQDLALHTSTVGTYGSSFSGYVVGMFYDEAGAVHEMTLDGVSTNEINDPPLQHVGPLTFAQGEAPTGEWTSVRSGTATRTLTYRVDGAVVGTYAYSVSETVTETLTISATQDVTSFNAQGTFSPGGTANDSGSGASSSRRLGGNFYLPGFTESDEIAFVPYLNEVLYLWYDESNTRCSLSILPYRYSNQLFGALTWKVSSAGDSYVATYDASISTPSGTETQPTLTLEKTDTVQRFDQFAYASLCPVTGQIARDSVPVCYV